MLASGTTLAGRYEIVGRIGAGGMSNVYKAKDQKLNRYVALKVLKPEFSTDATFVKKFRVEAQSAAGLSHPNIVNVYDVGEENGIYYIVMELVQGITLKHYIERKGKLDIREVLNISVQIASGMGAAHANRIIHRDIKPQNVIMSRDGKVKVTDFGIAKAADSTTVTTNAAGSVHYISPEQARGGYSDEKSDIYSLGITMYEMVTGQVPYDGENNVAVALQHIQGNMTPPSQINPDIPRAGAAAAGVGDNRRLSWMKKDVEKLRNASLNKNLNNEKDKEKLTPEERRRRQLEEEEREYENMTIIMSVQRPKQSRNRKTGACCGRGR